MAHGGCHPKPGDLIEIDRPLYQHWALYVGDGYVIHVTGVDEGGSSLQVGSSTARSEKAKVKMQLLKEVVGSSKWRVNNKYDHSYTPLSVKKILRRAERCIGKEVSYHVLNNNCEHFATWLRYGVAVSEQAMAAEAASTAALTGSVIGAVAAVVTAVLRER